MTEVAIIGAGPAGLMAAEILSTGGVGVTLYESMPTPARKFLMAGKSGLNITHDEPIADFLTRFSPPHPLLLDAIAGFGPAEIVEWLGGLNIDTFVGSSGHMFPTCMKASPVLRAWLRRLSEAGARLQTRHQWTGWTAGGALRFSTPAGEVEATPDATILALGGASWPRLGSTGQWTELLAEKGIGLTPFRAANCGFAVAWSPYFRERFAGQPVKPVAIKADGDWRRGEFVVTDRGIEGSGIYPVSALLRDQLAAAGSACLYLDLAPDRIVETLREALAQPRGKKSIATHLRRAIGIEGVKAGLLRELLPPEAFSNPEQLATAIKHIALPLRAPLPIDGAISSAGGVAFGSLTPDWMLRALPGTFCAGEMLDWEAPTGGYLLSACLATGRAAARGVGRWLDRAPH